MLFGLVFFSNAPRGKGKILDSDGIATLKEAATSSLFSSSKSVTMRLKAKHQIQIAPRTTRTYLKENGLKFSTPKKVPILRRSHRTKRLAFARKHIEKMTDFRKVMFTDSKMFCLSRDGAKCWYEKGHQPHIAQNKHALKCHVYLGVTCRGPTPTIFATSSSQNSTFIDKKTKKPQKGVATEEYNQEILTKLIAGGNQSFKTTRHAESWIFQQDNAPCHKANAIKELLQDHMHGRWISDWPPCSPDLSWIESVWSWLDKQLDTEREEIWNKDPREQLQAFKEAITRAANSIPVSHCQNYVFGVMSRMHKVVAKKGGHIGM